MKNILLACLLLAATSSVTYAQAPRPTASKSDFITKVGELNKLLLASDLPGATAKWDEINKIAQSEFGVLKFKLIDDAAIKDTADQARCLKLNASQRTIFTNVQALKNNLIPNRVPLINNLNLFAADML